MSEPNPPRTRLSDSQRNDIATRLQDAFADGQLSVSEFDERSRALYAATYSDELPALVDDLSPATPSASAPASRGYVTGEDVGAPFPYRSWVVATARASGSSPRCTPPWR